jgi:dTMP kinase
VFVTFEGIGGAGKTTQAQLLHDVLRSEQRDVVLTHEPGGTDLGEQLRELLLFGPEISAGAETALFAAARAELVDRVIAPAVSRGADVICDRYLDSSLAYQGLIRKVGVDAVLDLNLRLIGDFLPDCTFFLDIDAADGVLRRQKVDRIERGDVDRLRCVANAYRELAELFPRRIVTINGAQPVEQVANQIRERIRDIS